MFNQKQPLYYAITFTLLHLYDIDFMFLSPYLKSNFQKNELDKFLKNADTIVSGLKVEKESDYEANKILSDNIGFQMLKRAGWSEGGGLGDVGKLKFC